MKKISKRNRARLSAFFAAIAVALALFTGTAVAKAKQFEREAEAMYQKNLATANESLSDINDVILKGIYSQSAADQSSMCADVWMNAYAAKNAISALPIADIDMEKCYTFLSKTAEYAKAAEKQIASGKALDENQHETFLSIKSKTVSLAHDFEKIQAIYLSGDQNIAGGIDFSLEIPKTIASASATSESLNALNKNLSDSPKLIYDGPYSDALNEQPPRMLQDESEITLSKATQIAETFLSEEKGILKFSSTKEGNIPAYVFTKGNCYLEISVYGGKIVSFNANDTANESRLSAEECIKIAQTFLNKAGYTDLACDYYELANHIFTLNFHAYEEGVNCYTDLIKMKVNAANGHVCGFDALSYLTHHTQRTFSFSLTPEQAQSAVSRYLQVKDVKKALIPNAAEQEVLCYEYRCVSKTGNDELLVFIDAETGEQADILILQIGQNSVLTK